MFGPARNIFGTIAGVALALSACGGEDSTPVAPDAACESDGCVATVECPPGTRGDPAVACMEVDACADHPCGVGALCVDLPAPAPTTAEGRTCACDEGFEGDPVLGCTDIDACVNHACGANATCTDRPAPQPDVAKGRSCDCDAGFEGDAEAGCTAIDACINHPCGSNATCADLPAPALDDASGRTCACPAGLAGDAEVGCTEIDACLNHPCGDNADCTDKAAPALDDGDGRTCACKAGFMGDAEVACSGIDACVNYPCGAHASCTDKPAPALDAADGRTCTCDAGFGGDAEAGCVEIDACINNACVANATCTDLPAPAPDDAAGRSCACNEGYREGFGGQCVDINECFTRPCTRPAECQNAIGSYACVCPPGTTADGANGCELDGYAYVTAGTFTMGSPASEPAHSSDEVQHAVTLTRDFWLGETEVTQGAWVATMGTNPALRTGTNRPVERVSWYSALEYANQLSTDVGLTPCYALSGCSGGTAAAGTLDGCTVVFSGLDCEGYRLPTESEWEYAARGGTTTGTYNGELSMLTCEDTTLPPIAWFCGNNTNGQHHPVGQKNPNDFGLFDMLGNVSEWTWDRLGAYPGTVTDPLGSTTGALRVVRGGSYAGPPNLVRAANRVGTDPGFSTAEYLGFRLARTVP